MLSKWKVCGVLLEASLFAAGTVAIRAISDTSDEDLAAGL